MWFPLHKAVKKWHEQFIEIEEEYRQYLTIAQIIDNDGEKGKKERDDEGNIIYPDEDEPSLKISQSSQKEQEDEVELVDLVVIDEEQEN